MENRSLSVVAGLIALVALPCVALALENVASPEQATDWQQRLDKADALQAAGKARQDEGDRLFKQESDACDKKVLVNDCRNRVHKEHVRTTREARQLELDGKNLARQVKTEQLAERNRQQAEAAPQRAAKLQARQEETAAARQAAEDKAIATRADKAEKAVEGAQRKAAAAEKQRQKQVAHEARVADQMKKAAARKAKAAAGE